MASCSAFGSSLSPDDGDEVGRVFYFGFEIESITGIPEHQIEEYGCKYTLLRADFQKTLAPDEQGNAAKYDEKDVRAKVVFADAVYFVDRQGIVKGGDGYATIDKVKFADSLTLVGGCK